MNCRSLAALGMTMAVGLAVAIAGELQAQGAIFGTVRDSSGTPVPDADVILQPARKRTRSDFAGRYAFEDLGNDSYTIFARKLGFVPESYEARISAKGRVEVNVVLRRRTDLDTIRVVGGCDGLAVTNLECRRAMAPRGSIVLDYPEIDAFGERYVADLFRHIPGFMVRTGRDRGHVVPQMELLPQPYRCLTTLVDGRPLGDNIPGHGYLNGPPRFTKDLVALELYPHIDSVPLANKQYMRFAATASRSLRRCGVLLYWTVWAPIAPPKASLAPPPKNPSQFRGL